MKEYIYQDIARRTDGEIFIGVVGPVRTGKSTFISKFCEEVILPTLKKKEEKKRFVDSMPQSGSGVVITTAEPKFCPPDPAEIDFGGVKGRIRLCDSAGYMIEGAEKSGGETRTISTMWSDEPMSFEEISEIGTGKVAREHSTVAVLVTSDGSVVDIPRENYLQAEEKTVEVLQGANKPFVVVLNTKTPKSGKTAKLARSLEKKYNARVIACDIIKMEETEVSEILQELSKEFKIKKIEVKVPKWMGALDQKSEVIERIFSKLSVLEFDKIGDIEGIENLFSDGDAKVKEVKSDLATGIVSCELEAREGLFFEVLSAECGVEIKDEFALVATLKELKEAKGKLDKLEYALNEAQQTGYGVVAPSLSELELFEPELLKEGNQYGVRLKAKAPSLHIMRVDVETELRPIVGTEAQGEAIATGMLKDFENNRNGIWNTNMFGKPLSEMVLDGLNQKLSQMPTEVRGKIKKTVTRIVNEGKGGVICILL